jgi:hypothetical protein
MQEHPMLQCDEIDGRGVPDGVLGWSCWHYVAAALAELPGDWRKAKANDSGSQAVFPQEGELGLRASCQNLVITPLGS